MAARFTRFRRRPRSAKISQAKKPFFIPNELSPQTKPEIGTKDDPFEREAEATGEKVAKAGGKVADFMTSAYDYDFKQVKIHTGAKAAQMNKVLQAQAFTQGNDIYFNKGKYQPTSKTGRKLLGHEMTHVVQQNRNTTPAIQRSPDPQAEQAPKAEEPLSAPQFRETMQTLYGVKTVRVGTMENQLDNLGLPTTKPLSDWRKWYPGKTSIFYNYLVDGFRDFQNTFGTIPDIDTITFYYMNYTRTIDPPIIVSQRPEVPASYKNRELMIYWDILNSNFILPFARSNAEGEYGPGTPVAVISYDGDPNAAPLDGSPDKGEAVKRVVLHELAHGLSNDVRKGDGTNPAVDASMIEDYKKAIGWQTGAGGENNTLYDLMAPAVQKAIAEKAAWPTEAIISTENWNDPQWIDQPISKYAVEGGPGEDFAESLRAYIEKPDLLQARSPLRYNFIHARKDQWTTALRSTSPSPAPENAPPEK